MGAYVSKSETPEKQKAAEDINLLLGQAQAIVWEAESIADKHDLSFSMEIGGYGMGGFYTPVEEGAVDDWGDPIESGWKASSQSC